MGRWVCALGLVSSAAVRAEPLEVSAPIMPLRSLAGLNSGAAYPSSEACERRLGDLVSLTYPRLLSEAAPGNASITLQSDGGALTPAQIQANYLGVATYAYEHYDSKPYWIPRLVDDVDVCALKMGTDWHLPTQDEVESLSTSDLTFLRDTIAGIDVQGNQLGSFFFSLYAFVRARDGSLQVVDLRPEATTRVFPIGYGPGENATTMWQSPLNVGLRCFRTSASAGGDVPTGALDGGFCPGLVGVDGYVPDAGQPMRPDAGPLTFDAGSANVWSGGGYNVQGDPVWMTCPLQGDPCVAQFLSAAAQARQCFGHVSQCWMGSPGQCGYSPQPGAYGQCFWWDNSAVSGLVGSDFVTVYSSSRSACMDWENVGGAGRVQVGNQVFTFTAQGSNVVLACPDGSSATVSAADRAPCFDQVEPRRWICCDDSTPQMCGAF